MLELMESLAEYLMVVEISPLGTVLVLSVFSVSEGELAVGFGVAEFGLGGGLVPRTPGVRIGRLSACP